VAAATRHVLTPSIFFYVHRASWTALDLLGRAWREPLFVGGPLVLAHKAHHRVEAKISETNAVRPRTVNLPLLGKQRVVLEVESLIEILCKLTRLGANLKYHSLGHRLTAAGVQASDPQLPLSPAHWELQLTPLFPARLASSMLTRRLPLSGFNFAHKERAPVFMAHGARLR